MAARYGHAPAPRRSVASILAARYGHDPALLEVVVDAAVQVAERGGDDVRHVARQLAAGSPTYEAFACAVEPRLGQERAAALGRSRALGRTLVALGLLALLAAIWAWASPS